MTTFKEHMEYLDDINYELDFRDLYHFHHDIWVTDVPSRYIPLKDMTDDHIANTINFINNNGPLCAYGLGPVWLPKLMNELKRRGKILCQE